jgi:hypothetical protein
MVFNLVDREVVTSVNQQPNPGTYEVEWNVANYASNVYHYKLITDDFAETKKMILIK